MNNTAKKRLTVITLVFLLLFIAIIVHLYFLQIKKNNFFSLLGQQQYHVNSKILPIRGNIYDCKGQLIATEKSIISIFTTPNNLKDKSKLISFLSDNYPAALIRLNKNPEAQFIYIARNISQNELEALNQKPLADIYILEEPGRYYPISSLGAVIGRTDIDNQGISGLELIYNEQLAGTPSMIHLEKDARSGRYYFNKKTLSQGTHGNSVNLTIDSTLQFHAYEELQETVEKFEAKEGAVIIMDPISGFIYAMVSIPDINPNNKDIQDLSLLKNRIVTETYEFGSVMKTFLALSALEENLYEPESIIDCENSKIGYINGQKFSTWKEHGELTFSQVIEYSNNIGTAKIAQKVGTKLYNHYRKCGFGKLTGLNFPGQQKGYITHPSTWSKASLNSLSFGYEIRATLLQLACAFSIFANGGYLPTPKLVVPNFCEMTHTILYRPETVQKMRAILEKTCNQGTAHAAVIPGVTVLGKTGTARLLDEAGHYSPLKNIYTFAGIIEKGNYKRVIVTFIKEASRHDLYASTVAAPLFERIAQKTLIHDKIM
ncbi:MAG: penicillin-binding protein 2 [Candidatus Babeliaceae bacterium]|nr:penicillin-binding protein 2 [Candidatus Babeliaceae bacterium]